MLSAQTQKRKELIVLHVCWHFCCQHRDFAYIAWSKQWVVLTDLMSHCYYSSASECCSWNLCYNQWQELLEKLLFGQFVFLHLPPALNNVEKQWAKLVSSYVTGSKTCVKLCYRFATLYRGRVGILNTLFKLPIIFCHWL